MEVIISDPVNVVKTERTRAPVISISNPFQEVGVHPLAEISFGSERLQFLDGVQNAALPAPPVIRRIAAVVADSVTFTSPVTGQTQTLYVAEFSEALAAFYCKWYAADRQAEADCAAAAAAARIAAEAEAAAAVEPKS